MRQIKFMRYYFEDGIYFIKYEWGINIGKSTFTMPSNVSKSNSFVDCQFIGLKDKNKKEIYEGDIVKYYNKTGEVIYESKYGGYVIFNKNNKKGVKLEKFIANDSEIIGNICENKNLLKYQSLFKMNML